MERTIEIHATIIADDAAEEAQILAILETIQSKLKFWRYGFLRCRRKASLSWVISEN